MSLLRNPFGKKRRADELAGKLHECAADNPEWLRHIVAKQNTRDLQRVRPIVADVVDGTRVDLREADDLDIRFVHGGRRLLATIDEEIRSRGSS